VVDDEQLQMLADRLASDVLAAQVRSNALMRFGEDRRGALATAAVLAGAFAAQVALFRRVVRQTDWLGAERLYAQTVAVDRDRAHADVHYVDQRLRCLAIGTDDDSEQLVRGAAHLLVAFVMAGRPAGQRLSEVEHAYIPLREARDDQQPTGRIADLLPAYVDAWRRALT
jgi:hypothetical protein